MCFSCLFTMKLCISAVCLHFDLTYQLFVYILWRISCFFTMKLWISAVCLHFNLSISAVCLYICYEYQLFVYIYLGLGDTEKLIFLYSWSWSIWMFSSQWCHSFPWRLSQVLHVLGQCQWRLWLARIHMWRLGIWPPYWCLYWPCLTLKW